MNIENVTVGEIISAARAKQASLVAESAGHVVLGLARNLGGIPLRVVPEQVTVNSEGVVGLIGQARVVPVDIATTALRKLLQQLLQVSNGAPGPLAAVAGGRQDDEIGIAELFSELAAALIPINRGAAKRALGRLARETLRAKAAGLLAAEAVAATQSGTTTEDSRPAPSAAAAAVEGPSLRHASKTQAASAVPGPERPVSDGRPPVPDPGVAPECTLVAGQPKGPEPAGATEATRATARTASPGAATSGDQDCSEHVANLAEPPATATGPETSMPASAEAEPSPAPTLLGAAEPANAPGGVVAPAPTRLLALTPPPWTELDEQEPRSERLSYVNLSSLSFNPRRVEDVTPTALDAVVTEQEQESPLPAPLRTAVKALPPANVDRSAGEASPAAKPSESRAASALQHDAPAGTDCGLSGCLQQEASSNAPATEPERGAPSWPEFARRDRADAIEVTFTSMATDVATTVADSEIVAAMEGLPTATAEVGAPVVEVAVAVAESAAPVAEVAVAVAESAAPVAEVAAPVAEVAAPVAEVAVAAAEVALHGSTASCADQGPAPAEQAQCAAAAEPCCAKPPDALPSAPELDEVEVEIDWSEPAELAAPLEPETKLVIAAAEPAPAKQQPATRNARYRSVETLLDEFGDSGSGKRSRSVMEAARSLKRLAQIGTPTPPPAKVSEAYDDPSAWPSPVDGLTVATKSAEPRSIPPQAYEPRTPRRPRGTMIASIALLAIGLCSVGALWVKRPEFFLGRLSPLSGYRDSTVQAASPTAPDGASSCVAKLMLRDLPTPHEVLLRLGVTPVETRPLPTGVRLELVATAPGYRTERVLVRPDSMWSEDAQGHRSMALNVALQHGPANQWPSAPAGEVGGVGRAGQIQLTSTPPATELWLVVGAGSGRDEQVSLGCEEPALLLVVDTGKPDAQTRFNLTPPELRAAAQAGGLDLSVWATSATAPAHPSSPGR